MNTIKGPVTLGGGRSIPKEIVEKVSLPFEAKGFKSSNNSKLVQEIKETVPKDELIEEEDPEFSDMETKNGIPKKDKEYTKEELQKKSFNELKDIAERFGETGRSKKGIIKDILKHM